MAFNNFTGYGHTQYPNYNNFQPTYVPQYAQQSQQQGFFNQFQQLNPNNNGFVYVNGKEGAKAYILQPNSTIFLMDSDNPFFYIKSTNNLGQASIRQFKFEEIQFEGDAFANSKQSMDFVKIKDFKSFESKIVSKIEDLENQIRKQEEKEEVVD